MNTQVAAPQYERFKLWLISSPLRKELLVGLAIITVAIITRGWRIGDPAIQMDEQFYLLVGDRVWHGTLPFVDIWDRKPVGLFLIYAALRPFSPQGIVAYQLGALISAIATAFVIRRIAQRFANDWGAAVAAICYLLFLPLLGGVGGQSPVFYNLPMAWAALLIIRASDSKNERDFYRLSSGAMLLCGLAIQLKYTVLFEGAVFGLWLLVERWIRGVSINGLSAFAALLMSIALAPTLAVGLFYASLGQFPAFFDANFLSIFRVIPPPHTLTQQYLKGTVLCVGPLLIFALWSVIVKFRSSKDRIYWFIPLWTGIAIAGYFVLGNNYQHYALPVLVPLTVLCAPLFSGTLAGGIGLEVAFIWYGMLTGLPSTRPRVAHQENVEALASAMRPYTEQGCAYVNDGPVVLYLLTKSCLPTPYIFPEHLNNSGENRAINAPEAMKKLLHRQPSVIVVADRILEHPRNPVTAAMLNRALADNYHEIVRLPDVFHGRQQIIYARNDLK